MSNFRNFMVLSSKTSQCVAIGECGLDFFVDYVDRDKQERFFHPTNGTREGIWTAFNHPPKKRKSYNRIIELIKQHKFTLGGVIHGFSGSEQQALAWIKLGFYIGVGGTITYPRAQKRAQPSLNCPLNAWCWKRMLWHAGVRKPKKY